MERRLFLMLAAMVLSGCTAVPGLRASTIAHPDDATAQIEYFVAQPRGRGPWPTIILLHGYQPPHEAIGARAFADWGELSRLADAGFLAVAVSLPGYGNSTGSADFAGPFTRRAVRAVKAELETRRLAAPGKVIIQGTSLGALTGALVAADEPDLAGLVLISGLYDPAAFLRAPTSARLAAIAATARLQIGDDPAEWAARSALRAAPRIRARTLILNGEQDARTDPAQARALGAAIAAAGGSARVCILDGVGHRIPPAVREAAISRHIEAVAGLQADHTTGRHPAARPVHTGCPDRASLAPAPAA